MTGVYRITIERPGDRLPLEYYGSAGVSFDQRWGQHISALRLGRHVNPRMQLAFDKYGEDAVRCEVVELTDPGQAAEVAEQRYLDVHHGEPNCMNIASFVSNPAYCPEVRAIMTRAQQARVPDVVIEFRGGVVRQYPSQAKAASALGLHPAAVVRALRDGIPTGPASARVWGIVEKIYRKS